jgi:hypothetical protein
MIDLFKRNFKQNNQFSLLVDQIDKAIEANTKNWSGSFLINAKGFESFFPAIISYYDNLGIPVCIDDENTDYLLVDITIILEEQELEEEIREDRNKKIAYYFKIAIFLFLLSYLSLNCSRLL